MLNKEKELQYTICTPIYSDNKVNLKSHFVALLCIIYVGISLARQPIVFNYFNSTNGFNATRIFDVYQDELGFIWFATDMGLMQFDGGEFRRFKHHENENIVSNMDIIASLAPYGNDGDMILGTFKSAYYFNRKTYSFQELESFVNWPNSTPRKTIFRTIQKDKKGNYWFGSPSGIFVLNDKLEKLAVYRAGFSKKGSLSSNNVFKIYCDSKGRIFVLTNKDLSLFNPENETFERVFVDIKIDHRTFLYEDSSLNLWVSSPNAGLFMNPGGKLDGNYKYFGKSNGYLINNMPSGMVEDIDGSYLIADRDGGLIRLSRDLQRTCYYLPNPLNPNAISSKSLRNIYRDKYDNIWIGTFDRGVSYINRNHKPFELYTLDISGNGLINNKVRSLFQDSEGYIWVGTKENGGLSKLDPTKGTFKNYREDPNNQHSIKGDYIISICELDKHKLVIGTFKNGLNVFNKRSKKFKHYPPQKNKPNGLKGSAIYAMYKDINGLVWLGSRGELEVFNPKTETFSIVKGLKNSQYFLACNDSLVWVATNNSGIHLFNINTRTSKRLILDKFKIQYGMNCMAYDTDSNLVVANNREGLFIIDKDLKSVKKNLTPTQGFPHISIKAILVDDHNNIWASTENGLVKYNQKTEEVKVYKKNDGLQGNAFATYAALKTKNGKMMFGGSNGLNIFHPDSIKVNKKIYNVVFTDFKLFNKPIKINSKASPIDKHISLLDEISLNYKQNVFSISYVSASYSLPHTNTYTYKLENFDKDWIYAGHNREVTYTSLPAGNYTFMVKACNSDGICTGEASTIKVIIRPPWWATWWFRLIATVFIILLAITIYYFRVNQLIKQKNILEISVQERTEQINLQKEELFKKTEDLNDMNAALEERQQLLEEQSEELRVQAKVLSETNNELTKLNATKDKFFSIISHDIKNPLSSIMGISRLLRERFYNLEQVKVKRFIDMIDQSAVNLNNLLINLLQWAKSQSGKVDVYMEPVSLTTIIANIENILSENLKQKSLKLVTCIPKELTIYTDRNIIETVLRNLISNAIKYSDDANITIYTEPVVNTIKIVVMDVGVGIQEEDLKDLFIANSTQSTEGTQGERGTGLGLLICKELIESCGGTIGVESTLGIGSEFFITLPHN